MQITNLKKEKNQTDKKKTFKYPENFLTEDAKCDTTI